MEILGAMIGVAGGSSLCRFSTEPLGARDLVV